MWLTRLCVSVCGITETDECGNVGTAVQTLRIVDTQHPLLIAPADIQLEYGESTLPDVTGLAVASDNCVMAEDAVSYKDVETQGDCPHAFTLTRIWSVEGTALRKQSRDRSIRDSHPPVCAVRRCLR